MEQAATPAQVRRALRRAARVSTLDAGEVAALLSARGEDLTTLTGLAREHRSARWEHEGRPGVITYSPKVFVPVTRLCRDRCHYCTFATDPADLRRRGEQPFLSVERVLDIVRTGVDAGCREALFTLGDRPEDRWPAARTWLEEAGYSSTLDYVRALAIAVLEETGILPHLNPGVMSWEEIRRLRPVAPSMGLMLESISARLTEPGGVHHGSPDKDPGVRMRTIVDAGRQNVPLTSGLLVGIGEDLHERAESLLALRGQALQAGHLQEVIVQNFRAKPDTAARSRSDLDHDAYRAAIATARIVMPTAVAVQAPPNLTDLHRIRDLLDAGVDDLGGISPVTPDHVNPERPWPALTGLAAQLAEAGLCLRARLTAHPRYVRDRETWIDSRLHAHVSALATADGMAADTLPVGRAWQAPEDEGGYEAFAAANAGGRIDLDRTIDLIGRRAPTRSDIDSVFGDWTHIRREASRAATPTGPAVLGADDLTVGLRLAHRDPAALALPGNAAAALALMTSTGEALAELCRIADRLRAEVVGDEVTYVVNRNINFTNVCYTGCRFCAFAQRESDSDAYTLSPEEIAERTRQARAAGATEICMQGGIHPRLPGEAYFDLIRTVRDAVPDMHLHAFSPMEIVNGAARSGLSVREWLIAAREAGLGSVPGTAAEILDDQVRWVLTKGKLPADQWVEVIRTAHDVGLPSTATMMYGHVDHPGHWVDHIRTIRQIGQDTGGFTEFVPLPFVHANTPLYLSGAARPGPTARDNLAVHAMARVMLHGVIDNIQTSWVKLGPQGAALLLTAGVNDLGGTLMEETISRMAGSEHGSSVTVEQLVAIAGHAGRPARARTTLYGRVRADLLS